jgi:hypothetical protein
LNLSQNLNKNEYLTRKGTAPVHSDTNHANPVARS